MLSKLNWRQQESNSNVWLLDFSSYTIKLSVRSPHYFCVMLTTMITKGEECIEKSLVTQYFTTDSIDDAFDDALRVVSKYIRNQSIFWFDMLTQFDTLLLGDGSTTTR